MSSNRTFQMRYWQFRAFEGLNVPRGGSAVRSYHRPQANILTGLTVGIIFLTALLTAEVQALPIGRRDESTFRATPACVSWVNHFHSDANRSGLVGHKELPLCIRPAVDFGAQVFPFAQRTVSYVPQVFQADRPCIIRDSVGHQFFARSMEQGYRYGSFVAAHASKETPSTTSANGLNGRAFAANTGTAMVFHPSLEKECAVVRGIGSDHQTLDSKIHADDAAFGFRFYDLDFVREAQIPHLSNPLHLGILPAGRRYVRMLQDDWLAENSHALLVSSEVPLVRQRYRGPLVDAQIPFAESLQRLVAGGHLAEQGACQLRGDAELLTNDGVEGAGESVRVHLLRLKNLLRHPASSREVANGNLIEMLRFANFALDCPYRFQYLSLEQILLNTSIQIATNNGKDGIKPVVSTQRIF